MNNGNKKIVQKIEEIAEPVCVSQGLELVHVEYRKEPSGRVLRIFLDHPEGITVDRCSAFSRALGDLLDVYGEIEDKYTLEVSSPGIERPLSKKKDFERFQGQMAKILLATAIDGQKTFTGVLMGISEDTVRLQAKENEVALPFDEITKAHLVS